MNPLEFEALSHDEKAVSFGKDFAQIGTDLTHALDTFSGGGWEAVSHDLTIIANTIMFTFLVRRPKK